MLAPHFEKNQREAEVLFAVESRARTIEYKTKESKVWAQFKENLPSKVVHQK